MRFRVSQSDMTTAFLIGLRAKPALRARLRLGYCRKVLGRFDEALEEFRQAEHVDPTSALPLIGMAELLEAQGRIDEAMAVLESSRPG